MRILFLVVAVLAIVVDAFHDGLIAIRVDDNTDPQEITDSVPGYTLVRPIANLPNHYLLKKKKNLDRFDALIERHPLVLWSEPQVYRRRYPRWVPEDPLYPRQWHLADTFLDAHGAWDLGYAGDGVQIAVVDDGLQKEHPDFADKFSDEGSYDFNNYDPYPVPDPRWDTHGTSAAGVAAASSNSVCGVGVAPNASVSGIQVLEKATTDADEAEALSYRNDINHIYTNSWGPVDDGTRLEGPGVLTTQAMELSLREGRNGLGSIYVWAAGNGAQRKDNCNYDGYANLRYTITVSSITDMGRRAYYSEYCAATLVATPSSGDSRYIITSDLLGLAGEDQGSCRTRFGGTSASAPQAAGAIALALQANPYLSWRDVFHLLVHTARRISSTEEWFTNGAGHDFSHAFGFGVVDARALVEKAKEWIPVAEEESVVVEGNTDFSVKDALKLETVQVEVDWKVQVRGEVKVTLRSPSGSVAILQESHGDTASDIHWTYSATCFWDEISTGIWTLSVYTPFAVKANSPTKLILWGTRIA